MYCIHNACRNWKLSLLYFYRFIQKIKIDYCVYAALYMRESRVPWITCRVISDQFTTINLLKLQKHCRQWSTFHLLFPLSVVLSDRETKFMACPLHACTCSTSALSFVYTFSLLVQAVEELWKSKLESAFKTSAICYSAVSIPAISDKLDIKCTTSQLRSWRTAETCWWTMPSTFYFSD